MHMALSAASSDLLARFWLVFMASNGLVHRGREDTFEHCSSVAVGTIDVLGVATTSAGVGIIWSIDEC